MTYKDRLSTEASTSNGTNGIHTDSQPELVIPSTLAVKAGKKPWDLVTEEAVDTYWEARDGKIQRSKDARMCRHGAKSMCDHCMPLEVNSVTVPIS